MFLPGRSMEQEKAEREAAYRRIETWSKNLIANPEIRNQVTVSVQEVQCMDPNCSPVDTIVTLTFAAGQGMVGVPLEAKLVAPDHLAELFPPADILEKWYRGEDAVWPPEPEPVELRFDAGTRVLCRVGPEDWAPGTVEQLWYREKGWPEGAYAPYKMRLDDGRDIFAPQDSDQVIRRLDNSAATSPADAASVEAPKE